MFPKNCVRIEIDIEKAQMVQAQPTSIQKLLATDDYTFFRERESPAESSLKNKVIIDIHTGAATVNPAGNPVFAAVKSSRCRFYTLRSLMRVL